MYHNLIGKGTIANIFTFEKNFSIYMLDIVNLGGKEGGIFIDFNTNEVLGMILP
jgi:hypothetical protein